MDPDDKLQDLLSPQAIKLEVPDDVAQQYRLVDGRLIALDTDNNIMSHFVEESDLCLSGQADEIHGVYSEDQEVESSALDEDAVDSNDNVLIQLMDIRTSLSRLRVMLEQRIGTDLSDYEFWLQDSKMLESHKTLVEQCIDRAGLVQVNIQIRPNQKRINIVDVLKPDEEFLHMAKEDRLAFMEMPSLEDPDDMSPATQLMEEVGDVVENVDDILIGGAGGDELMVSPAAEETGGEALGEVEIAPQPGVGQVSRMAKWMVDAQFKADQTRLRIPEDPKYWSIPQVRHWIQWAVRQFNLTGIKLYDWSITGKQLCDLSLQDFKEKCPSDPGDLFWTHLELLRNCKFIAVVQNEDPNETDTQNKSPVAIRKKPKATPLEAKVSSNASITLMSASVSRSGYNGQIQLWQFLLELLTSTDHTQVIQWIGTNGEFKLQEPEIVARLWGLRKHKPTMNYEKLSRALRYYYDGDMISKVHGKRFVYRFVCDLKQLIGYDAGDLARLVNKGAAKYDNEESSQFSIFT